LFPTASSLAVIVMIHAPYCRMRGMKVWQEVYSRLGEYLSVLQELIFRIWRVQQGTELIFVSQACSFANYNKITFWKQKQQPKSTKISAFERGSKVTNRNK